MKKYVSPIIEIEEVEVEDIIMASIELGEDELPGVPLPTGPSGSQLPKTFSQYFNEQ